ncbi:MAG: hypothetical protein E7273_04915 [Pseudobutyrivibrio ruminis]|nr:hypothetical protein [Pseudobutyrivibrio ruminis]
MALNEVIKELISDKESLKIVASQNKEGVINAVPKGSVEVTGNNEITYVEILESGNSYKNIVYSIWFNKPVSITIIGKNKETYLLSGHVQRVLTCGTEYENYYRKYKETKGFDIAAAVKIDIDSVLDLNINELIDKQRKEHPFYIHYDSIVAV